MKTALRSAPMLRKFLPLAFLALAAFAIACLAGCSCSKTVENWTVTFKDGNDVVKTVDVEASDDGVLVDCPRLDARDDATFGGWTSDSPSSMVTINEPASKQDGWTVRVFGDGVVVSSVWTAQFTVTFTDGEGNEIKSFTVNDGDPLPTIDDPKREGYEFAGWDASPATVHENLTINATWKEAKTWTVTYMDGDGNVIQEFKVADGAEVPDIEKPERKGYVFAGWDSKPQFAYKDLTINAVWHKIWKVTYMDGDGNVLKEFEVEDGQPLPNIDKPSREGYEFEGWDTDAETVTQDLTINAKWKSQKTWKVVFTDGNGKTLNEQTVIDGQDAVAPDKPSREGYEFDGWDADFTKVSKDLTVNAKWKVVETPGMKNALKAGKQYLEVMPFSHDGLADQLEFDGFTHDEAVYAADNCGADWDKQAEEAAKRYMDIMPLSREELIYQLEYDKFTHEQAVHGADSVNL